jgi:hypothetical protein
MSISSFESRASRVTASSVVAADTQFAAATTASRNFDRLLVFYQVETNLALMSQVRLTASIEFQLQWIFLWVGDHSV